VVRRGDQPTYPIAPVVLASAELEVVGLTLVCWTGCFFSLELLLQLIVLAIADR
jgi:hypothetical protein